MRYRIMKKNDVYYIEKSENIIWGWRQIPTRSGDYPLNRESKDFNTYYINSTFPTLDLAEAAVAQRIAEHQRNSAKAQCIQTYKV